MGLSYLVNPVGLNSVLATEASGVVLLAGMFLKLGLERKTTSCSGELESHRCSPEHCLFVKSLTYAVPTTSNTMSCRVFSL